RAPKRLTRWPAELCVVSADDREALVSTLERVAQALTQNPQWPIAAVAAALAASDRAGEHRLAMVVTDTAHLAKSIAQSVTKLRESARDAWATRGGVAYGS